MKMNRLQGLITVTCILQGNNSFPISYAAAPTLVPRFNALSVFAPELDASIGKPELWSVFPSARDRDAEAEEDVASKPLMRKSWRAHGPPTDALYTLEANIPVIGKQRFQLRIRAQGMAELVIDGLLKLNDVIFYEVDPDGEFTFELSEATKKVLKKFRTNLVRVRYDRETDTPTVIVRPPLPTNIKLKLERKAVPVLS